MTDHQRRMESYRRQLEGKSAGEILAWSAREFGPERIALATSFGAEDQVLTALIASAAAPIRLFTLDTGRQFQETYDTMQRTMERYKIRIEVFAPDASQLAEFVAHHGPNAMYSSVELRKTCCRIRKINPLRDALATVDAWICGIRQEQSVTRFDARSLEWDETHSIFKISPLVDWTEEDVWSFIRENEVPYNPLHDRGFRSIGCAPCTRTTEPGEDIRSGRWWWEPPERRECGLHERELPKKGQP